MSNFFCVSKKQPSASILSPANNATFKLGTLALLHAMAIYSDDGLLKDDSLEWNSDLNGFLGIGDNVAVYRLFRGKHVITLTAADTDGNVATDQETLFVFDTPTPDGDFDGDVDLLDFKSLSACMAGPRSTPLSPACLVFDFDDDGDVDQADLVTIQNCYSGADTPADANCAR